MTVMSPMKRAVGRLRYGRVCNRSYEVRSPREHPGRCQPGTPLALANIRCNGCIAVATPETENPAVRGFRFLRVGAARFELGTSSPPDLHRGQVLLPAPPRRHPKQAGRTPSFRKTLLVAAHGLLLDVRVSVLVYLDHAALFAAERNDRNPDDAPDAEGDERENQMEDVIRTLSP
jgi:hypothetical protein